MGIIMMISSRSFRMQAAQDGPSMPEGKAGTEMKGYGDMHFMDHAAGHSTAEEMDGPGNQDMGSMSFGSWRCRWARWCAWRN